MERPLNLCTHTIFNPWHWIPRSAATFTAVYSVCFHIFLNLQHIVLMSLLQELQARRETMEDSIRDMQELCDFTRTVIERGLDLQVGGDAYRIKHTFLISAFNEAIEMYPSLMARCHLLSSVWPSFHLWNV